MNVIQVQQGSQEWLDLRKSFFTASEAPAALGKSKYQSRSELLKQKATGMTEEVSNAKQALFNRGHQSEADARPFAEMIVKTDLYPVTATLTVDGINLLASLDGAVMMEDEIFEHKLYSESLAADVRAGTLDPHYTIQMDQQLLVSGAKRCLFMTSDGTEKNMAWCWYESSQAKFDELIAGWKQFRADLETYQAPEVIVPAVAAPQMDLPAVSIQVNGTIALVDNLDKFGVALTAYIEKLNRKPETDQDFANLEDAVKRLKAAEDQLDAAESSALAQTDSIDAMRRTVALHRDTARTTRLLIDKLVKAEKENRRTKIIGDAVAELHIHIKALNERTRNFMPVIQSQFQEVVKGLKSLDSMKDKVSTELARCKIEANSIADRIQANLETKGLHGYAFLFSDIATLCLKPADDFQNTVTARITHHEAAEAEKEAQTRARIQAEEQAKAERAAREKLAAEQAAADKLAREHEQLERDEIARLAKLNTTMVVEVPAAPVSTVVPMPARAPVATAAPATLQLGKICARLGVGITKDFISAELCIEPKGRDRSAVLYSEDDFSLICDRLIDHIRCVAKNSMRATA